MFDENTFLQLFGNDAFIPVNKHLAKEIGLVDSVIYGELISLYKYYKSQNQLVDDKWFYCTIERMEDATSCKKDQQDDAIKRLIKKGMIEKKMKGLPAKRHFSIDITKLIEIYSKKDAQAPSLSAFGNSETKGSEKEKPSVRKNRNQGFGNSETIKRSNKKNLEKELINTTTTRDKIDIELIKQFPNVNFEKAKQLAFEQFEIKTDKQYYASVLMKLNDLAKQPKKKKAPTLRKEMIPSWLNENEEEEKIVEEKMDKDEFEKEFAKLQEQRERMRNKKEALN
jgi:hypothetical protein